MKITPRYELNKPEDSDYAKIGALNENADKLDTALDGLETGKEPVLKNAAAKTTPADADAVVIVDSADGQKTKRLTWANIKAALKTWLDSLYAAATHNHAWSAITGKPSTFAPSAHAASHRTGGGDTLTAADVKARPDTWTPTATDVGARPSTWNPAWGDVTGKPATFPASSHTHPSADLTDTLPVSKGGTGLNTLTSGNFLRGNGTGALLQSTPLAARQAMSALTGVGPTTITVPVSGWTGTGPWVQTVSVSGVTAADTHLHLYKVTVTDAAARKLYDAAVALLDDNADTVAGGIKLTCYDGKPETTFQLSLEGARV